MMGVAVDSGDEKKDGYTKERVHVDVDRAKDGRECAVSKNKVGENDRHIMSVFVCWLQAAISRHFPKSQMRNHSSFDVWMPERHQPGSLYCPRRQLFYSFGVSSSSM
jgi:hypothetical protein